MEYDLSRFTTAHGNMYETALSEIKAGRKESHWMWYIFPQIKGLGKRRSPLSIFYAFTDVGEAKAFLDDEYLGGNLIEITTVLFELESDDAREIFGSPDDRKLRSCMTLFACISNNHVFKDVLGKFFKGVPDYETLSVINMNFPQ